MSETVTAEDEVENHGTKENAQTSIEVTTTKNEEPTDIKTKYFLAVQEAQMWKQRYLSCTTEKLTQLRNIETSLMVLEARLHAERRDIEHRFTKQSRTIKEQKRKIAKLTTANQKLLTGLMALSEQAGLGSAPPPYTTHQPPKYNTYTGLTSSGADVMIGKKPLRGSTIPEEDVGGFSEMTLTKRDRPKSAKVKRDANGTLNSNGPRQWGKTHRSMSLTLDRHAVTRSTRATEC